MALRLLHGNFCQALSDFRKAQGPFFDKRKGLQIVRPTDCKRGNNFLLTMFNVELKTKDK